MKDYVDLTYKLKDKPHTEYPFKLIEKLIDDYQFKKEMRILELGPGRGELLMQLQFMGFDVCGLDTSQSTIDVSGGSIKYCNLETDTFPFEDNSFDIVYHKSVIEHISDFNKVMKETYRVLKPAGRVIIMTPDWNTQMTTFYDDHTHVKPYTTNSLRELLERYEFENVVSKEFYQLPSVWKFPKLKYAGKFLQNFLTSRTARFISKLTKIQTIRWSVELMVLGTGVKSE